MRTVIFEKRSKNSIILIWLGVFFVFIWFSYNQHSMSKQMGEMSDILSYFILALSVQFFSVIMDKSRKCSKCMPIVFGLAAVAFSGLLYFFYSIILFTLFSLCLGPVLGKYMMEIRLHFPRKHFFTLIISNMSFSFLFSSLILERLEVNIYKWGFVFVAGLLSVLPFFFSNTLLSEKTKFTFKTKTKFTFKIFLILYVFCLIVYWLIHIYITDEIISTQSMWINISVLIILSTSYIVYAVMADKGKIYYAVFVLPVIAILSQVLILIPANHILIAPFFMIGYIGYVGYGFFLIALPFVLFSEIKSHFVASFGIFIFLIFQCITIIFNKFLSADWLSSTFGRGIMGFTLIAQIFMFTFLVFYSQTIKEFIHAGFKIIPKAQEENVVEKLEGYTLTNREKEVAQLLIKGVSRKEIENTLHISSNTVNTYCNRIFSKTGSKSHIDLMTQFK